MELQKAAGESTCDVITIDSDSEDEIVYLKSKVKPKRVLDYTLVEFESEIEREVSKIRSIREITSAQIKYMVLRDVNYYLSIFAGQCAHSWRHYEFKKNSVKSSKNLYGNTTICSYRDDQYMSVIDALKQIFSGKGGRYDDYIVKVLLPEALIKICMRIHQCSKEDAEDYLYKNDYESPIEFKDKDLILIGDDDEDN